MIVNLVNLHHKCYFVTASHNAKAQRKHTAEPGCRQSKLIFYERLFKENNPGKKVFGFQKGKKRFFPLHEYPHSVEWLLFL